MIGSDLGRLAVFAALPFARSAAEIVVLAVVAGIGNAFFRPAVLAGLPNLVSADELPGANALHPARRLDDDRRSGRCSGACSSPPRGPHLAYWVNAATFAFSALLVARDPRHGCCRASRPVGRGRWSDLAEGYAVVRRSRALVCVLVVWSIVMLARRRRQPGRGLPRARELPRRRLRLRPALGRLRPRARPRRARLGRADRAQPRRRLRALPRASSRSASPAPPPRPTSGSGHSRWSLAGFGNGGAVVANITLVQRGAPDRAARPRLHAAHERQLRRARASPSSPPARSRTPSARAGPTPAAAGVILCAALIAARFARSARLDLHPAVYARVSAASSPAEPRRRCARRATRARSRGRSRWSRTAIRARRGARWRPSQATGQRLRRRAHRPARGRQVDAHLRARRARRAPPASASASSPSTRRAPSAPGRCSATASAWPSTSSTPASSSARWARAASRRPRRGRRCRRCRCSARPARTSSSSRRSAPARASSAVLDVADTVVLVLDARRRRRGAGAQGRDHGDPRHRSSSTSATSPAPSRSPASCAARSRSAPGRPPLLLMTDARGGQGTAELWQRDRAAPGRARRRRQPRAAPRRAAASREVLTVASARARRYLENAVDADPALVALLEEVRLGRLDPLSAVEQILAHGASRLATTTTPTLADIEAAARAARRPRARDARLRLRHALRRRRAARRC